WLLADPALRRRLGAAARRRVFERCSWERVTAATLEAYGVPSAARAETTIPSLQYGASRPAAPRVARARLAAWPATNGRRPSARPNDDEHRAQERPRRVEVLDHLARDDEARRLQPERGDGVRRLRVDEVRLEALRPGPRDALLVRVEPDERVGDLRQPGVEPHS